MLIDPEIHELIRRTTEEVLKSKANDAASLLDIAGAVFGIVTSIVGVAVVYLRLFVKTELQAHETSIIDRVEKRFADKSITEVLFNDICRRVALLEESEQTLRRSRDKS